MLLNDSINKTKNYRLEDKSGKAFVSREYKGLAKPNTKANNPIKHEYKIWIVFTHSHIHTQTQIQNANIHIETCLTTLVNCKMQNSNEIPLYMVMYRMVKILKIPQSVGKDVGKMNSHTLLLRKEK